MNQDTLFPDRFPSIKEKPTRTDQLPCALPTQEWTVSQISQKLKAVVEGQFSHVAVRGEISSCKKHTSGHVYFTLKDEKANLDAVCWKGVADRLEQWLRDGLEVTCQGRLTTYAGRSKYQIVVTHVAPTGEGALLKLLEERKKQFQKEGLFDESRKKSLPFFPQHIAIVTSPTGAVIHDILHRLRERMPSRVSLWPVAVQGETAAQEIAHALRQLHALESHGLDRPDLIIVARGGGSLEDLWAFNEEEVVRAVAASTIPVMSAVGHETDVTLIDFVADKRAPTPTAAAEMAVPVRSDLMLRLEEISRSLALGMQRLVEQRTLRLKVAERGLPSLTAVIEQNLFRLGDLSERFQHSFSLFLRQKEQHVENLGFALKPPRVLLEIAEDKLATKGVMLQERLCTFLNEREKALGHKGALLESFSYKKTLERGFCIAQTQEGEVCTTLTALPGDDFNLRFKDGVVRVRAGRRGKDQS